MNFQIDRLFYNLATIIILSNFLAESRIYV